MVEYNFELMKTSGDNNKKINNLLNYPTKSGNCEVCERSNCHFQYLKYS